LIEREKLIEKNKLENNVYPKAIIPKKIVNFFSFGEVELARQITLYEQKIFKKIQPKELLNLEWSKKNSISVNVKEMVSWFNRFSSFVVLNIVHEIDAKKRSKLIEFWIKLTLEFIKIKNFNTVFEILSGLTNSSVSRFFIFKKNQIEKIMGFVVITIHSKIRRNCENY
jgi:hypothetical protein